MNISDSNFYENSGRRLGSELSTFFYQIDTLSIKTLAKDVFYLEERLEIVYPNLWKLLRTRTVSRVF